MARIRETIPIDDYALEILIRDLVGQYDTYTDSAGFLVPCLLNFPGR